MRVCVSNNNSWNCQQTTNITHDPLPRSHVTTANYCFGLFVPCGPLVGVVEVCWRVVRGFQSINVPVRRLHLYCVAQGLLGDVFFCENGPPFPKPRCSTRTTTPRASGFDYACHYAGTEWKEQLTWSEEHTTFDSKSPRDNNNNTNNVKKGAAKRIDECLSSSYYCIIL